MPVHVNACACLLRTSSCAFAKATLAADLPRVFEKQLRIKCWPIPTPRDALARRAARAQSLPGRICPVHTCCSGGVRGVAKNVRATGGTRVLWAHSLPLSPSHTTLPCGWTAHPPCGARGARARPTRLEPV